MEFKTNPLPRDEEILVSNTIKHLLHARYRARCKDADILALRELMV